jgi:hypothetical protein
MPNPPASNENHAYEINIRSPRFYIARTVATCWHCGSPTSVVAIAVTPGHETLDTDDDALDEDSDAKTPSAGVTQQNEHPASAWSVANNNAFLFYVDSLPAAVLERINQYQPAYRPIDADADAPAPAPAPAAGAGSGSYWANHCEKCGRQLDDHELFCEPEGAFLPTSEATAAAIRLVLVDEPFEASAAGYSYEPPFFDAMIRG